MRQRCRLMQQIAVCALQHVPVCASESVTYIPVKVGGGALA